MKKAVFSSSRLGSWVVWLGFSVMPVHAGSLTWINGSGNSCLVVCQAASQSAVQAGAHIVSKRPFTVCRARGGRVGFNVEPTWSNRCYVAIDGKELAMASYDCLCHTAAPIR
jgi:hypothetical protein